MGEVSEAKRVFREQAAVASSGALILDDLVSLSTLRYRPLYSAQ